MSLHSDQTKELLVETERLLGQLQEFREWSKREFQELKATELLILNQIEKINQDRWTLYGKMTVLNSIVIAALELISHNILG